MKDDSKLVLWRDRTALNAPHCVQFMMIRSLLAAAALSLNAAWAADDSSPPRSPGKPPVIAPFTELDTLCVNDWWNRKPSRIVETRVPRDEVIAFGIYTVSAGQLKLSAQLFPLYPDETRTVRLEFKRDGAWQEAAEATVNDLGWSALFRIPDWDTTTDTPYRIRHGEHATYEGVVRRDPTDKSEIVVATLSCNSSNDRGLRPNYVRNINHQDPDLVFFAGDQSYYHRQHTAAWLKFGLQFRDVFRDRPCVTIPDDHDIGQPNLWGESGKLSVRKDGSDGGYSYHPEYVRMVERCQTAHLPDPYDPEPINRGIGVYYTALQIGPVDFAVIEDRKWKDGPDSIGGAMYERASLADAQLLGERQEAFLTEWIQREAPFKVVLSQTMFAKPATHQGWQLKPQPMDPDCNGWPMPARDRALRILGPGVVMLAGDQHLGMAARLGVDDWADGPLALMAPGTANGHPRMWTPEATVDGEAGESRGYTGRYLDGLGNRLHVLAVANPEPGSNKLRAGTTHPYALARVRGSGYALARFSPTDQEVMFDLLRFPADTEGNATGRPESFTGLPLTVTMGLQADTD